VSASSLLNSPPDDGFRRAPVGRRKTLRPPRVRTGRAFWFWAIVGAAATIFVGLVYAHYLKRTYGWSHGHPWEIALLRDMHAQLPRVLDEIILVFPWFGTNLTILPGVAIASYNLVKRGRRDLAIVLVVAAAGNYAIAFFLKYALDRPRPTVIPARGEYTGPSYPSGHAMLATSVLFVVAYLLRRERGWRWPYYVVFTFGLFTVYSRLYLGVHWPTDVLSGGVLGVLWLIAMLRAMDARREELMPFGRRVRAGEIPPADPPA
jgi:undecaprenyl-diphosphatase